MLPVIFLPLLRLSVVGKLSCGHIFLCFKQSVTLLFKLRKYVLTFSSNVFQQYTRIGTMYCFKIKNLKALFWELKKGTLMSFPKWSIHLENVVESIFDILKFTLLFHQSCSVSQIHRSSVLKSFFHALWWRCPRSTNWESRACKITFHCVTTITTHQSSLAFWID